jgi:hypothetical protein
MWGSGLVCQAVICYRRHAPKRSTPRGSSGSVTAIGKRSKLNTYCPSISNTACIAATRVTSELDKSRSNEPKRPSTALPILGRSKYSIHPCTFVPAVYGYLLYLPSAFYIAPRTKCNRSNTSSPTSQYRFGRVDPNELVEPVDPIHPTESKYTI